MISSSVADWRMGNGTSLRDVFSNTSSINFFWYTDTFNKFLFNKFIVLVFFSAVNVTVNFFHGSFALDNLFSSHHSKWLKIKISNGMREKCQNTELILVPIFRRSTWIWRDTKYLSVFSPNAGKYGPELTPYLDTFHAVAMPPFYRLSVAMTRSWSCSNSFF